MSYNKLKTLNDKIFLDCVEYAYNLLIRKSALRHRISKCHLVDKEELINQCFIDRSWERYDNKNMRIKSMFGIMSRYLYKMMFGKQWQTKDNFYCRLEDNFDVAREVKCDVVDETETFMKFLNIIKDSQDKEILIKRFVLDMSWQEIADSMNKSLNMPVMRFAKMKNILKEAV